MKPTFLKRHIPLLASAAVAIVPFQSVIAQDDGSKVNVDVTKPNSQVTQITYRRGAVVGVNVGIKDEAADLQMMENIDDTVTSANLNFLTAVIDLNNVEGAQQGNQDLFKASQTNPQKVVVNTDETDAFSTKRFARGPFPSLQAKRAGGPPNVMLQFSGMPASFQNDYADNNFRAACSSSDSIANYYPLPEPGSVKEADVRAALVNWATRINSQYSGMIWSGNQEPAHTAGILLPSTYDHNIPATACIGKKAAERMREQNGDPAWTNRDDIDRAIDYWAGFSSAFNDEGMAAGAIQLNSQDNNQYANAATDMVQWASQHGEHMKLDYFTVQNYKEGELKNAVANGLEEARQVFKNSNNPDFMNVKFVYNRYSTEKKDSTCQLTVPDGIVTFLSNEKDLMNTDMVKAGDFYAYSVLGAAFNGFRCKSSGVNYGKDDKVDDTHLYPSLIPATIRWLQNAPVEYRPFTSSAGLNGFALIHNGDEPKASIVIWNRPTTSDNPNTPKTPTITLNGFNTNGSLTTSNLVVSKYRGTNDGSGHMDGSIDVYPNVGTVNGSVINGITIKPGEFVFITLS